MTNNKQLIYISCNSKTKSRVMMFKLLFFNSFHSQTYISGVLKTMWTYPGYFRSTFLFSTGRPPSLCRKRRPLGSAP